MESPKRKYGFPLLMLLGFAVGGSVATAIAFGSASSAQRFSYTTLFDLVVSLGALGVYFGHITGAAKNLDSGFKPFGPIPSGVLFIGAVIVVFGTFVICGSVVGIMTLIKGPPPH